MISPFIFVNYIIEPLATDIGILPFRVDCSAFLYLKFVFYLALLPKILLFSECVLLDLFRKFTIGLSISIFDSIDYFNFSLLIFFNAFLLLKILLLVEDPLALSSCKKLVLANFSLLIFLKESSLKFVLLIDRELALFMPLHFDKVLFSSIVNFGPNYLFANCSLSPTAEFLPDVVMLSLGSLYFLLFSGFFVWSLITLSFSMFLLLLVVCFLVSLLKNYSNFSSPVQYFPLKFNWLYTYYVASLILLQISLNTNVSLECYKSFKIEL